MALRRSVCACCTQLLPPHTPTPLQVHPLFRSYRSCQPPHATTPVPLSKLFPGAVPAPAPDPAAAAAARPGRAGAAAAEAAGAEA